MSFFRSVSTYAVANVINSAIPFILLKVLTDYLSPEEYGYFTTVDVFNRFTLPFIILGVNSAIATAFFKNDRRDFPAYLSSALVVPVAGMFMFFLFFLVSGKLFEHWFQVPYKWTLIGPAYCLLQTITLVTLSVFQINKKALQYGIYQNLMTVVNLSLSVLFVVKFHWGWQGRTLGILCAFAVFALVGLFILWKKKLLVAHIRKDFIIDVLKFGLPLLPHLVAGPLIQFTDRFFINSYAGVHWTGIYNVAFQLGTALSLITVAFNQAYSPHLFETLSKITKSEKIRIVRNSYLLMIAYLAMAVAIFAVCPLLFRIFINVKFAAAQQFILVLALGSAFNGMYMLVTNYIFFEKKTHLLAWVTISNAVFSVLLNLILVRKFGAWGAASTYCITQFAVFISVWILSNRIYPMPWLAFFSKKTPKPKD
jgi:O-antigen/teichoic acid export membrane protein